MTTDTISINKNRDSVYEFEATVEGISPKHVEFRLVITDGKRELMYKCYRRDERHWFVTIPQDSGLTSPSYDFRLESIVDGYYFVTLTGTVKVHDEDIGVKVTPVQTTTKDVKSDDTISDEVEQEEPEADDADAVVPPVSKEEDTPPPTKEPTKPQQRSSLDIANSIIKKTAASNRDESVATKSDKDKSEINKKVSDALAILRKKHEDKKKQQQEENDRAAKDKQDAERIAEEIRKERLRKQQSALETILKK